MRVSVSIEVSGSEDSGWTVTILVWRLGGPTYSSLTSMCLRSWADVTRAIEPYVPHGMAVVGPQRRWSYQTDDHTL